VTIAEFGPRCSHIYCLLTILWSSFPSGFWLLLLWVLLVGVCSKLPRQQIPSSLKSVCALWIKDNIVDFCIIRSQFSTKYRFIHILPNNNQPGSFKLLLTTFLIQLLLADPYSKTFCGFPKDPSLSFTNPRGNGRVKQTQAAQVSWLSRE
jgi:hypothetical protein